MANPIYFTIDIKQNRAVDKDPAGMYRKNPGDLLR
jgi:hypothetical protein